MEIDNNAGVVVGGKFKLIDKIGRGGFGDIYRGINMETKEYVAIKIENRKKEQSILFNEARIYHELSGASGIPEIFYVGTEGEYKIMVMELLGPNLSELLKYCEGKFTLRTSILLTEQILARIEQVHSCGYIHRDIKPENITVGVGTRSNCVYLIDFGLAKQFCDPDGVHIPYRDNKPLIGTAKYASINAHLGVEQSRRDDLESFGYLIIHMTHGTLPWEGIKSTRENRHKEILKCKGKTHVDVLCKGMPGAYKKYFSYIRKLKFEQRPDYFYIRSLFQDLFDQRSYAASATFDWVIRYKKEQVQHRKNPKEIYNFKDILYPKASHPPSIPHASAFEEEKITPECSMNSSDSEESGNESTPRLADPVTIIHGRKLSSNSLGEIPTERGECTFLPQLLLVEEPGLVDLQASYSTKSVKSVRRTKQKKKRVVTKKITDDSINIS